MLQQRIIAVAGALLIGRLVVQHLPACLGGIGLRQAQGLPCLLRGQLHVVQLVEGAADARAAADPQRGANAARRCRIYHAAGLVQSSLLAAHDQQQGKVQHYGLERAAAQQLGGHRLYGGQQHRLPHRAGGARRGIQRQRDQPIRGADCQPQLLHRVAGGLIGDLAADQIFHKALLQAAVLLLHQALHRLLVPGHLLDTGGQIGKLLLIAAGLAEHTAGRVHQIIHRGVQHTGRSAADQQHRHQSPGQHKSDQNHHAGGSRQRALRQRRIVGQPVHAHLAAVQPPAVLHTAALGRGVGVQQGGQRVRGAQHGLAGEIPRGNAVAAGLPALGHLIQRRKIQLDDQHRITARTVGAAAQHEQLAGQIHRVQRCVRPRGGGLVGTVDPHHGGVLLRPLAQQVGDLIPVGGISQPVHAVVA